MRAVYADPPYMGLSKRLYGDHPDYAGEVDHVALLADLGTYDAWALSASMKSLPTVLASCPADVLVLSWHKTVAPPMGDHRIYSWEPVIIHGGRKPAVATRTSLVCSPPMFTFRGTPDGHVIGEKPEAFCWWVFDNLGLTGDDTLADLFPGSGAVARAWARYSSEPSLLRPVGSETEGQPS